MAFKMVVFDWDGTILDSTGLIAKSIRLACLDADLPDPGEEIASYVIGLGLSDALRHAAPGATQEQINRLVAGYRKHYLGTEHELNLFEGVPGLLSDLNALGVICTVATGKSRAGLDRAMAMSDTAKYFMSSRCADECHSKPHPQMLLQLMEEFDLPPNQVVMIGDTTHDLNMAQSAKTHAISVQTGAHPPSLLDQVPHLKSFHSINQAAPWLLQTIKKGSITHE